MLIKRGRLWPQLGLGLLVVSVLVGCTSVSGTGRKQFIIVTRAQEQALGLQVWDLQLQQQKRSEDLEMKIILERVGRRIATVADLDVQKSGSPPFDWELALFQSEEVNAFCLPGGKVAIYTGILPVAENEAGLAAIIGHEVAHAVARHGAERLSQAMAINMIARMASGAVGQHLPQYQGPIMNAFGLSTSLGIRLPFSREHELEADYLGLVYMAKAGYDPKEAVPLWERMKAAAEKRGHRMPEFLSTHPNEKHRIDDFQQKMAEAETLYVSASAHYGRGEWVFQPQPAPQGTKFVVR
jgi:predicted Zn-dependent protease